MVIGFRSFGDVLDALYANNVAVGKEGQVMRDYFIANGISIPLELSNETLGRYFYFEAVDYGTESILRIRYNGIIGLELSQLGISLEAFLENLAYDEQIDVSGLTGKAKCIYEKLLTLSEGFRKAIQKFDGEFPVSHLKFEINNTLPVGNYGITKPPEGYNITIEMSNNQLANISDIGGAVAIAHEVIHAEIYRKMLSAAQKGDLNLGQYTTQNRIDFMNSLRDDFPGLYDYYWERYHPTWNHNLMAQHYRSIIADIAQQFDNNLQDRQVYEDIAWAGLRVLEVGINSIAWDNLTNTEQQRILTNLSNFFHNGSNRCN